MGAPTGLSLCLHNSSCCASPPLPDSDAMLPTTPHQHSAPLFPYPEEGCIGTDADTFDVLFDLCACWNASIRAVVGVPNSDVGVLSSLRCVLHEFAWVVVKVVGDGDVVVDRLVGVLIQVGVHRHEFMGGANQLVLVSCALVETMTHKDPVL